MKRSIRSLKSFEAGCYRLVDFIGRKQSLYVYSFSAKTLAKVKNVGEAVTGRLKLLSYVVA